MTGNPLLLLSALLELVGVQFISMGLLGELLARTYFESQGKSAYVVRATLNLDNAGGAADGRRDPAATAALAPPSGTHPTAAGARRTGAPASA